MGRSRCDCTQRAYEGYMTVSLVGRMAMGSLSSVSPDRVTQATSGEKSAMWSFSFSSAALDTKMGK